VNPIGTKRRSILMEDNVTSDAVKDHPAGTGRNGKRVIVGVAAAVAVVLAVGGVCGYRAWEDHRVSVARGACGSAVAAQKKAVDSYRTLLASDDTANALKTDVKDVKDPRSVTVLRKKATMRMPGMVSCDASSVDGLDAARKKADGNAKRVDKASKSLGNAVRTVESSKLDKIVADADALYRDSEGKVQDPSTRDGLEKAIKARDAKAIGVAVKAVEDSKAAKDKADAEAREKAEREAQAVAAAAAQAQAVPRQPYSGHSGGQSSSQSYSGGSQGQGGGSPSGNSPAPSIHYDWEDNTGDQYNCQPDKFCPLG
jgi:uncharacterized membrane protein YgcG